MIPPISSAEVARVAALHRYQVLDTPREDAYDDLVTLAAQLCDALRAAAGSDHPDWKVQPCVHH